MARAAETPSLVEVRPGPIRVEDIPYLEAVGRGLVAGHRLFEMNARTDTAIVVGPVLYTDITQHPVNLLSVPQLVEIKSTSGNDVDPAGTGAHDVIIYGIPADKSQAISEFEPPWQSESIALDGTNFVRSIGTYASAIVGSRSLARGSLGNLGINEGDIDIQGVTDANLIHRMPAGRSEGRIDQMTTPLGWEARFHKIWVTWTGNVSARWRIRQDTGSGFRSTLWDGEVVAANSGSSAIELDGAVSIVEGATAWFQANRALGPVGDTMQINAIGVMNVINSGGVPDTLPP